MEYVTVTSFIMLIYGRVSLKADINSVNLKLSLIYVTEI